MTEPPQVSPLADAPLSQFWWLHDARWYQGVLKRFGPEAANEINAEAMKFVARRLAMWFRHRTRVDFNALPMAEFVAWFDRIPQVMWTEEMYEVRQTVLDENAWETVVPKNFALKMLRIARALDTYECPCLDMRAGWFEGMGISVRDSRVECQRTGGEVCRFHAVIDRDAKKNAPIEHRPEKGR